LVEGGHPLIDARPVVAIDHAADFLQVGHSAFPDESQIPPLSRCPGVLAANLLVRQRMARSSSRSIVRGPWRIGPGGPRSRTPINGAPPR
jgi:hypothetical protein